MYRVVLIDDEAVILEGLKRVVKWENYDCQVVGTAFDAKSGNDLIRQEKPDILFTDIRMPGQSGLTMLAGLRSEFPDMQVTVMTGYRDFSYAQEAIRLGVTRFLLKPTKMAEINEALEAMTAKLKEPSAKPQEEPPEEEEKHQGAGSFLVDSAVISNIDLKRVLAEHIQSGKDITMVVKSGIANNKKVLDLAVTLDENKEINDIVVDYAAGPEYLASMDIFVTTKKWLISMVRERIAHNFFHMDRDLILGGWNSGKVSVNAYEFEGVALYNDSVEEYFKNSMALLKPDVHKSIFDRKHPIYTKVRDRVPAYYGEESSIDNCMVADGCMLEGSAKDSILFRQVTLAPGAHVEDCVIMNDTTIGEGAELKNVILDKNVTVRPGAKLIGTRNNPIVIKRGDTV